MRPCHTLQFSLVVSSGKVPCVLWWGISTECGGFDHPFHTSRKSTPKNMPRKRTSNNMLMAISYMKLASMRNCKLCTNERITLFHHFGKKPTRTHNLMNSRKEMHRNVHLRQGLYGSGPLRTRVLMRLCTYRGRKFTGWCRRSLFWISVTLHQIINVFGEVRVAATLWWILKTNLTITLDGP